MTLHLLHNRRVLFCPWFFLFVLATGPAASPAAVAENPSQFDKSLYQGLKWRNIGPFRGGRSVAVAGLPSDSDVYYFGGVGGGVWKTDDAGENWRNISDGFFKTSSVGAIAVSTVDPNIIYVGMGEHAVRGVTTSHGNGIYKSMDAGKTWTHMGLEATRAISRIRLHPRDPHRLFVAAQGAPYGPTKERGIYRSVDGGTNWELVLHVNETAGASDLSMDPNNPRILFASFWDHLRQPWEVRSGGPGSGIYKSGDGGDTWEELQKGLPELMGKTSVAVAANSDRVYAMVEADPDGGLYRSDDGGKSWKRVNKSWSLRARAWYYTEVFADPQNENIVWVLNAPMMKSIDGGVTFKRVRVPHGDTHDLWINPKDSRLMINANDGGACVSKNGGRSWSTLENQPTAQFYRVNADNRLPYFVYGGQQDNSTVGIASRSTSGAIGWKDWHDVGGCESGFVAFNPDNPLHIYAGCFMGLITEYDLSSKETREIMAYPVLPAAIAPREMKYRFNWNAPIVVSKHNPRVIYHAAQVVLRTDNRGNSWNEISSDLTRNEKEKQGPGGTPITIEGAGGEIYNTITYLAESPHDPRTLWVGSDDGLVHLTRDGGNNWKNITPDGIGEALVNAIEVSPHRQGTAYLAVSRYKFNDFSPHVYRTENYGKSWQRLVEGIAAEDWVRVVREDILRQGLLYAGTEGGVYVSFDDGGKWQPLQLNLPVTPVTDLKVHHNDLVAATQGRSFWILDNLSPLQQLNDKIATDNLFLFQSRTAMRSASGDSFGGGGSQPRTGSNPPSGAMIDFVLAETPEQPVTIEIIDDQGRVIRSYRGLTKEKKEKETAETTPTVDKKSIFEIHPGMNRLVWDLRHEKIPSIAGLYVFGSLDGRRAIPGNYKIRVAAAEKTRESNLKVLRSPNSSADLEGYRRQDDLMRQIDGQLTELQQSVIRLRAVRDQIEGLINRTKKIDSSGDIGRSGKRLVDTLTEIEEKLIQKRAVDGQTVINFPARLNHHFVFLRGSVDAREGEVTEGSRRLFADLSDQWTEHKDRLQKFYEKELNWFNELIRERQIPAVVIEAQQ